MITVIETKPYGRRADNLLAENDRIEVARTISENPTAGDIMRGTGGVRKLRVAMPGRGKRGCARVIYYYHNEGIPVFLLDLFVKNEKDNLTKAERNILKDTVKLLVSAYVSTH